VKKGRNLFFNELFEFALKSQEKSKLEVTLMSRGEGGDEFLGYVIQRRD
jgi:hypothetical protein